MTLVILLGLTIGSFAQEGGLFGKGPSRGADNGYSYRGTNDPLVTPNAHGLTSDQGATNEGPLGSGIVALVGFGAAYMIAKKRREE